jgi:hypothetical protein
MNFLINFLDKAFCAAGFHVWSAPFIQRYEADRANLISLPDDHVCICIKEGCPGKQLFLNGKWVKIRG